MNFIKGDIFTKTEGIYPLTAILGDYGIEGFDIHDSADFEEFLLDSKGNWDYVDNSLNELKHSPTYITFYLPKDEEGQLKLEEIKECLKKLKANEEIYGTLELEISAVKEEDWENNWKEYFKPFPVGERFIIKPTWETAENSDNKLILEIDPASTFGTGQHETTKLCIEGLERLLKKDDRLLDLGTGSGILGIAALLLGAQSISIVDITQNAVSTAAENIRQNGFSDERFKAFCGDVSADSGLAAAIGTDYDIITANIVADVIISMKDLFHKLIKIGGILIVSGIIDNRLPEVLDAISGNELRVLEKRSDSEWNMIAFERIE